MIRQAEGDGVSITATVCVDLVWGGPVPAGRLLGGGGWGAAAFEKIMVLPCLLPAGTLIVGKPIGRTDEDPPDVVVSGSVWFFEDRYELHVDCKQMDMGDAETGRNVLDDIDWMLRYGWTLESASIAKWREYVEKNEPAKDKESTEAAP